MRVLFLGVPDSPLISFLEKQGESVVSTTDPLSAPTLARAGHEYLISYGFRHIIREDILSLFPNRAINLHISLLPWNRGADPNLWSFLENTPKGVTIHQIDKGIDTGRILIQRKVSIPEDSTLRTSYDLLQETLRALFYENWQLLKTNGIQARPQSGPSTSHKMKDALIHKTALRLGFDTPIKEIADYGRTRGLGIRRSSTSQAKTSSGAPCLILRADAGPEIGFGHVTRCLTLGREWTRHGGRAILLSTTPTESTRTRAARFGVSLSEVPSPYPDPEDAAALNKEVAAAGPNAWIVVDGYRFDANYLSTSRAMGARVLAIDDGVRLSRYDADMVLDQNLGASNRNYGAPALLGTHYTLLRPEFAERPRPKRSFTSTARTLLISLGGGDSSHAATAVFDAIRTAAAGLEITVAIGADSSAPRLPPDVRIERNPDLPALMEWADLAILAGGTTSWESAYMGLPAIYVPAAKNQRLIADALVAAGAGLCAEDAPSLAAAVGALRGDANRRGVFSASASALVDGLGAQRVRNEMLSFSERICS